MTSFKALTPFACDRGFNLNIEHNPYYRQTVLGCKVLQILQDMYGFNLTYVLASTKLNRTWDNIYHFVTPVDDTIDIYVKPLSIKKDIFDYASPILPIFNWRVGFILRDDYIDSVQHFYTLPFSHVVWACTLLLVAVGSCLFYVNSWWERRLLGSGECSFVYESFIAVSAACQHSKHR